DYSCSLYMGSGIWVF
nr:immunoglobulin light chain junction region [Macaca mulatta]MOW27940.1 immunoglobulin light chain junction region [Macaca mulatta]MOW28089.1 immunoglobulin light chain junction region [Macaca mulatta]MOW28944.1 immunoglobulin light chain junction region [Macaca mulatta]MOW29227.1 immunoglobulin light chain junction region [Macaca mulatta]